MEFSDQGSSYGGYGDFDFSEKSVRQGFIKKVYGILTVQLIITFGLIAIFTFIPAVNDYVRDHPGLWWASLGLTLVLMIALACSTELRRKWPANLIALIAFTICEGVMLGCAASYYDAWEVAVAIIATIVVAAGLTLFAFQTKIDFTMMAGALMSLAICFLIFGIFALIFKEDWLTIMFASLGALIFSLYIVFDTQLIIGGKHKLSISPEEYIFAALNLYLDVINLFLMLLTLIGVGGD